MAKYLASGNLGAVGELGGIRGQWWNQGMVLEGRTASFHCLCDLFLFWSIGGSQLTQSQRARVKIMVEAVDCRSAQATIVSIKTVSLMHLTGLPQEDVPSRLCVDHTWLVWQQLVEIR